MKIAIVGAGKLGSKVADSLIGGNHSITVIDVSADRLQKISSHMDVMAITANAKEVGVLKDIHISSFDFLLAAGNNDEENIVIAAFAKALGCSKVIASVRDPEHVKQYDFIRETMDIDYLVNPDMAVATEICRTLVEKNTLNNGMFSMGKCVLIEFQASKMVEIVRTPIRDISQYLPNVTVVAIARNGKVIIPHGDTIIHPDDSVYVMGAKSDLAEIRKRTKEKHKYNDLSNVMIIGGGNTGLFLAKQLVDRNISVKIIEADKERCYYLAEKLDNVMILHGNATDTNLMEEENLEDMDAFITCTGYDEDNLLLALMAKRKGVEDVIAKVSRDIYTEMLSDMGVDMALNPLDLTVSNIMRIIQGSKRIMSSQLIHGQAEVLELNIAENMRIVGKSIKSLKLPEGMLIGAIHRGSELIVPNGRTVIKAKDRVIVLCLLNEIVNLEEHLLRVKSDTGLFG